MSYEEILAAIEARDRQDSEREIAPLRPADDAVFVDTSALSLEESVEAMKRLALEAIGRL